MMMPTPNANNSVFRNVLSRRLRMYDQLSLSKFMDRCGRQFGKYTGNRGGKIIFSGMRSHNKCKYVAWETRRHYFCNTVSRNHLHLTMKNFSPARKSDWMGIASSVGCLIHCLLMPVLLSSAASFTAHEEYHWLDFIFLALAAVAVWFSARKTNMLAVRILLIVAWAVFAGSIIWEETLPFASVLMYLGSVLLIVGHVLNLRQVHSCASHDHKTG